MATTLASFTRPADPVDSGQLSAKVSSDIAKSVWVYVDSTQAYATGNNISEADRAAIQTSISAYVYVGPQQQVLTKNDVGLGNVDNTSDTNKPVSTAATNALAAKADTTAMNTGLAAKADATATTNALAAKADAAATTTALAGKAAVPVYALLANGTVAMAFGTNSAVKVTPTATATFTTTVPPAGSVRHLIILTAGASSFTVTFGAGFKPTATLATGITAARVFVLEWISDGINLYEVSRTVAMVA